ncbi:MAG: DUF3617 domain-containing protein [Burkholderiales bacterium]|nr:DUF3617 domain-containing protein [Burkholderiales bacterium]
MKPVLLIAATAVFSFATSALAQEMPGGLWEIKTKMDMPGLPPEVAAQMGNRTMTHCVKPGERKWSEQRNPNDRGDKNCEQTDMKVDGNKVSWKMTCKDGTSGEGTVAHNGKDAYKMDMTMNMKQGSMKMQTEGKRIADTCEKK